MTHTNDKITLMCCGQKKCPVLEFHRDDNGTITEVTLTDDFGQTIKLEPAQAKLLGQHAIEKL